MATAADHCFGPVAVYCGEKNGKYPDGNQIIVQGGSERAAFDSPLIANRLGAVFTDCELAIQGHVHEDHMTGLHLLQDKPVYAHAGDIDMIRSREGYQQASGLPDAEMTTMFRDLERDFFYAPRPDAIAYEDGSVWDLGDGVRVHAIHAPGHTSGHCVLLVEPCDVAFTGDIDLTGFGPYYGDATSSLRDFRMTLDRVADIPARVWVTSHHRGVYTERAAMLRDLAIFRSKIDQRSNQLIAHLRDTPATLEALVAKRLLYPLEYNPVWVNYVERHTIRQHLDELIAASVIVVENDLYMLKT